MYLDSTLKSLEVLLGGTITTNQLVFNVAYGEVASDNSTSAPKANDGVTNNATAVTMVAAPGSSLVREVFRVSIYNADTVSQTVTVQINDNGTKRIIVSQPLAVGYTLAYDNSNGWYVFPLAVSGGGAAISAAGSSVNNGTVVFSNSNNVSFGMNGSTITASVTVASTAGMSAGISTIGQTAGTSGLVTNQLILVATGAATLSGSTAAGGATVTVNVPAFTAGIGAGVTGSLSFSGDNGVSLSQSAVGQNATLHIAMPSYTGNYMPYPYAATSLVALGAEVMAPLPLPYPISMNTLELFFSLAPQTSAASTASQTLSISAGIFASNSSTWSALYSTAWTSSYTYSAASASQLYSGMRKIRVPFAANLNAQGPYYIAVSAATATANLSMGLSYIGAQANPGTAWSGGFGINTNVSNTQQFALGWGRITSFTSSYPVNSFFGVGFTVYNPLCNLCGTTF